MRIAFLCGSLEPGHDGVGDYTRQLAVECIRQGHACVLVALNDNGGGNVVQIQEHDGASVECLRCDASLPWELRVQTAGEFLRKLDPCWVSLQFVPYWLHPKGLPWRAASGLKQMIAGRPLHVMFHELWIGFGQDAPWKERCVGWLQRLCLFRLLRVLKPKALHTSNSTYVALLAEGSVNAAELPLFGNIPVIDPGPAAKLPDILLQAGIPGDPVERRCWWLAVFFGTLHSEWKPQPLAGILLAAAEKAGRRIAVISVGRLGAAGEAIWEGFQREHGDRMLFVKTGEQTLEQVSRLLQSADFGIASSPWNLMGKSSSAAAMLDHGLSIIYTRDSERARLARPAETLSNPAFHRCDAALEAKLIAGLPKHRPAQRVDEICTRFLAALKIASQ